MRRWPWPTVSLALAETAAIAGPLARALRDRAALAQRSSDAIALLERSAAVAAQAPNPLASAAALVDLAAAQLAAGDRAAARAATRAALDPARSAGARPLAQRAAQVLREAGGRPRRASGLVQLTASERRVAELAVTGATNPEIAERLTLSTKTIETHLGSTYRKLGIGSRAELPEALRRGPQPPS